MTLVTFRQAWNCSNIDVPVPLQRPQGTRDRRPIARDAVAEITPARSQCRDRVDEGVEVAGRDRAEAAGLRPVRGTASIAPFGAVLGPNGRARTGSNPVSSHRP
jgi:hypothetical protein